MNQRSDLKLYQTQIHSLQLIGFTILLLTIGLWQLFGVTVFTSSVFCLGILLLFLASLTGIMRRTISAVSRHDTILLAVLETVFLLFMYGNYSDIRQEIGFGVFWMFLSGIAITVMMQIIYLVLTWKNIAIVISRSKAIKTMLLSVICLVIGFLLNIECFNTWQRQDSYSYFRLLSFLSPASPFLPNTDGLMVGSHLAPAYALWSLLFMSVPHISDLNALYLSNMVLIAMDVILFYLLFKRLLPEKIFRHHVFYALVATGAPWIFGMSAVISPELLMTTGMLLLLYAVFSDRALLAVLSVFVLCGSKEVGGLPAATVLVVRLLHEQILYRKSGATFAARLNRWIYYACCCSLGFIWLIQLGNSKWMMHSRAVSPEYKTDGSEAHSFSFSWINIKDTLLGNYIWNFRWIFICLIAAAMLIFLIHCVRNKHNFFHSLLAKKEYCIIAAALFVFVLELCSFNEWILPRYYMLSGALLSILGLCAFQQILDVVDGKIFLKKFDAVILAIMIWVQSYTSIDAVTLVACRPYNLNTGTAVITAFPQHAEPYEVDPYFDARAEYNRQTLYFTKALDKAYAKIDKEAGLENSRILCTNEYNGGIKFHSLYTIWGFGYSYVEPKMFGKWNREGKYRYLSYEQPSYTIDPTYIGADEDLHQYLEKNLYYIEMPWGDTVIEPLLKKYPLSRLFQTIRYRGWVLKIYQLEV